jgi:hypothetical protein
MTSTNVTQDLSSNATCPKQQLGHSDGYLIGSEIQLVFRLV